MKILYYLKADKNVNGAKVIFAEGEEFGKECWIIAITYDKIADLQKGLYHSDLCARCWYLKELWTEAELVPKVQDYLEKAQHNYIFG